MLRTFAERRHLAARRVAHSRVPPWRCALAATALVAIAGAPAIAGDFDQERWKNRVEELDEFSEDQAKRKEKKDKEAAREAKKLAKEAEKQADKDAKDALKELNREEQLERAEKRAKEALKRNEERLETLAEKGKINPTNIPVLDGDFSAMAVMSTEQIEGPQAHQRATGAGILVAVLDSGFNLSHPSLQGHLCPIGFDAVDIDHDAEDLGNGFDDDMDGESDRGVGHGTFVAGMVLMAAPDAMILPVRIADDEGRGTEDEVASGIAFAIAVGVDVINLSLEAGSRCGEVKKLLRAARKAGIVIVTSAGNSGEAELGEIADREYTICVGAVDPGDQAAAFSNSGNEKQHLSVYAPGVDLWGPIGWPYDEAMCAWSGTSFSAGIVSGAVALRMEVDPMAGIEQIQADVEASVDPAYDVFGMEVLGAGRINLRKVVER